MITSRFSLWSGMGPGKDRLDLSSSAIQWPTQVVGHLEEFVSDDLRPNGALTAEVCPGWTMK